MTSAEANTFHSTSSILPECSTQFVRCKTKTIKDPRFLEKKLGERLKQDHLKQNVTCDSLALKVCVGGQSHLPQH